MSSTPSTASPCFQPNLEIPIEISEQRTQANDSVVLLSDVDSEEEGLEVLAVKRSAKTKKVKTPTHRDKISRQEDIVDLTCDSPRQPATSFTTPPPAQHFLNALLKCNVCLDVVSHPTSTICGHLFCEAYCIADKNWVDELDLRRAFDRLQTLSSFPLPSYRPDSSSLLQTILIGQESTPQPIKPVSELLLERSLKMNAGPIPGFDLSRFSGEARPLEGTTLLSPGLPKKRPAADEKSRSASPASDRSAAGSPASSGGSASKKARAQSIVRTTYYSPR